MGLLQPMPPKVKFSNLMRVLGDEQIANPTAIEAKVGFWKGGFYVEFYVQQEP